MPFSSATTTARRSARAVPTPRPAKPERCRKDTRKRLKRLKGPKAHDGFFMHPDAIERAWIEAKCRGCGACDLFD